MRAYIKYLLFAVFFGAFCCLNLKNVTYFSDIVFKFSFSEFEISTNYIENFLRWFFPLLVFQMFFGTYIYRHFCSASVYYFSRCNRRVSWFLKEVIYLYPYTLMYLIIMLLTGTIVASVTSSLQVDKASFIIMGYYLIIHSLYLYFTTLLINILAIKSSSSGGFIIVAGFQLFCIAVFAYWQDILDFSDVSNLEKYGRILQYNTLSHLVLDWHSSNIDIINEKINRFNIVFDLNWSVGLFVLITIAVIIAGCIIVKKKDFIVANNETGGI